MTAPADRLITEALAKSGVLWLTSAAGSAPVWYAHIEDKAYVVSGPGEQFCPPHRGPVEVVTRSKDTRARLASFTARAEPVHESDDDFEAAVSALASGRLNAPAEDLLARWRSECEILRLTPDLTSVVVRGKLLGDPAPPSPNAEEPQRAHPVTSTPSTETATPTASTADHQGGHVTTSSPKPSAEPRVESAQSVPTKDGPNPR